MLVAENGQKKTPTLNLNKPIVSHFAYIAHYRDRRLLRLVRLGIIGDESLE